MCEVTRREGFTAQAASWMITCILDTRADWQAAHTFLSAERYFCLLVMLRAVSWEHQTRLLQEAGPRLVQHILGDGRLLPR